MRPRIARRNRPQAGFGLLLLVLGGGACATGAGPGRGPVTRPPPIGPVGEDSVPPPAVRAPAAGRPSSPAAAAAPGGVPAAPFEIPYVEGEVAIAVRYPEPGQRIVPDSNFVFGSVGTGAARLRINGIEVPVEANGAFLAWLPTPPPERGDTAFYRLAVDGPSTAETEIFILRPPVAPPPGEPSPWLDPGPLADPAERWILPGESESIELAGEAGLRVWLEAGDRAFPFRDVGPQRGELRRYGARLDLSLVRDAACDAGRCRRARAGSEGGSDRREIRTPAIDSVTLDLVAARDGRERRRRVVLPLAVLPGDRAFAVRLEEAPDSVNGRSGVVVGRPTPSGPYRWRFPDHTLAPVSGRLGDRLRIRLGDGIGAWVAAGNATPADAGSVVEPARVHDGRPQPVRDGLLWRVGLERAVPVEVRRVGPDVLAVLLYDAWGETDRLALGPAGTGLRDVSWTQEPGPIVRVELAFDRRVWGWDVEFEDGDATAYEGPRVTGGSGGPPAERGAVLRLAVRWGPAIDADAPLAGRRVAVDPGHPGAGSYGPTGLYEGDANLAVALALVDLLESAGARPVLIRPDRSAVGLYERTRRAREAHAEIFVSIHNNALPDGVRPFDRAGTSTYYYHPQSAPLARAVQGSLVGRLGLRDLGVLWGDLAVVRDPWMPSVLVEGAFMMIPAHEAALRTPEFQRRYALGVFDGIRRFFEAVGREAEPR